jgi:hypothetical protein
MHLASRRFWGWRSGMSKRIVLGAAGVNQGAKGSARRDLTITSPCSVLPHERTLHMALSDQLTKLAAKAKEAEDRAAAAKTKAKAELEQDVKAARESAQAQADQLHKNAQTDKEILSAWWDDMQRSWHQHLDAVRKHVDERRATHDLKTAQRNADSAEEDAAFAIDYAYGAIEEAEYAVLDATLARMDADELAVGGAKT